MAKKLINKKSRVSVVKKRWYNLVSPQVFNSVVFGETPAADPKMLIGRTIKTSLSQFLKGARRSTVGLQFKITEVKGSDCHTEFELMEIMPPNVKRLVKRAKKRIDDSFVVVTKDETKVRLKPILLVKDSVQRGILSDLRKTTQEFYTKFAKELTFNELLNKVLMGDASKDLKSELKKVYPVAIVDMRMLVKLKK
ncbi:MAG: hypothetical protein Q8Q35_01430 [Nanoarchaeota archaeon]|nr:hypothetical protein [Nanoarchaeota archaeon]